MIAACALFFGVIGLVHTLAPGWGDAAGARLHQGVQGLGPLPTDARRGLRSAPPSPAASGEAPVVVLTSPPSLAPGLEKKGKDGGAPPAPPKSIYVPAAVVARYASSRRVSGVPAVDEAGNPVGVRVSGVSGSGLRDGDVVTMVEGTKVTTPDQAVMVIVGALASGKKVISGEVLRDGVRIPAAAEVPQQQSPAQAPPPP